MFRIPNFSDDFFSRTDSKILESATIKQAMIEVSYIGFGVRVMPNSRSIMPTTRQIEGGAARIRGRQLESYTDKCEFIQPASLNE